MENQSYYLTILLKNSKYNIHGLFIQNNINFLGRMKNIFSNYFELL